MLPKQVSMGGCEISCAGDPGVLTEMCERVEELDLTDNNVHSWEEVSGSTEVFSYSSLSDYSHIPNKTGTLYNLGLIDYPTLLNWNKYFIIIYYLIPTTSLIKMSYFLWALRPLLFGHLSTPK